MLAGVLGMVWVAAALNIPMAMYLEALGATGFALGLLAMLPQIAMIVQIPATLFVEKRASRKGVWFVCALLSRVVYIFPVLAAFLPAEHRAIAIFAVSPRRWRSGDLESRWSASSGTSISSKSSTCPIRRFPAFKSPHPAVAFLRPSSQHR